MSESMIKPVSCDGNPVLCPQLSIIVRLSVKMEEAIDRMDKGAQRFDKIEESLDRLEKVQDQTSGGAKVVVGLFAMIGTIAAVVSSWPGTGK